MTTRVRRSPVRAKLPMVTRAATTHPSVYARCIPTASTADPVTMSPPIRADDNTSTA